jgi:hypothetical protein
MNRVSNNQALDVFFGIIVERNALILEYLAIDLDQILNFHSWKSCNSPQEYAKINIPKHFFRVATDLSSTQTRV